MNLYRVHVTQWRLRNPAQVPALIEAIRDNAMIPPVMLAELEDGTVFIHDGHHRSIAFWLAGKTQLEWGDYILLPVDHPRVMRGKLADPAVRRRLLGLDREDH
jgi:hypothetical protein